MSNLENYYKTLREMRFILKDEAKTKAFNLSTRNEKTLQRLLTALHKSHVFEVSDSTLELLMETENKIRMENLPYKTCFIDAELDTNSRLDVEGYSGWCLYGISAFQVSPNDLEFLDKENISIHAIGKRSSTVPDTDGGHEFRSFYTNLLPVDFSDEECESVWWIKNDKGQGYIQAPGTKKTDSDKALDKSISSLLRLLLINFLDFVNNPEVEWVERDSEQDVKGTEEKSHSVCPYCGRNFADNTAVSRHIRRKHPDKQPKTSVCKLTGKTKRYVKQYEKLGRKKKREVRKHWVRGHYRRLRSDYFTNKQGEKVWIPPHMRGDGVLVPKTYSVEAESNS